MEFAARLLASPESSTDRWHFVTLAHSPVGSKVAQSKHSYPILFRTCRNTFVLALVHLYFFLLCLHDPTRDVATEIQSESQPGFVLGFSIICNMIVHRAW